MRAVRFLGAAVLACASVPLVGVGSAHAETVTLVPSNAGYFWALGMDKPEQSPATTPNVTGTAADGVSAGKLAVAARGGSEDKVSFLYFDLFSLPADITVSKAVVTMKTVNSPPQDITVNASPELVAACKAGDQGFSGDDGANLENSAPDRLCSAFSAKGSAGSAPGTYQWDITALAQTWVSGSNDGVAFTRDPVTPNSSFQVVFDTPETATLAVEYQLPVTTPEPPLTPPTVPEVPNVGAAPAPPVDPGFAPEPPAPLAPAPVVNAPPAPVAQQPTATTPVALSTRLRPENQLWLAALLIGATLLLLSLVLGDPRTQSSTRRTTRLSQALAGRSRPAPVGVMRPRHL